MTYWVKKFSACFAMTMLVLLGACGGGSSGTSSTADTGTASGSSGSTDGGSSGGAGGSASADKNEVMVSWSPPTQNVDGSALGDLAGYKIYYGVDEDNLSDSISVDASSTSYTMTGLLAGTTYYFAVATQNLSGVESDLSAVVSTTV